MSTAKKEPGLAMLVIVLALICLVVAALLGLVNQVTAPAIAANTEKTIQDSLKVVLPADSYEKVEYDGGHQFRWRGNRSGDHHPRRDVGLGL